MSTQEKIIAINVPTLKRISESSYCFGYRVTICLWFHLKYLQILFHSWGFKNLKSFNFWTRFGEISFLHLWFHFLWKKSPNLVNLILQKRFLHFPKIEKEMRDLLNVYLFTSRLFNQNNSGFQKLYSMWVHTIDQLLYKWHIWYF